MERRTTATKERRITMTTKTEALYKITQFGRKEEHDLLMEGKQHEAYQIEHARTQLLYALVQNGVAAVQELLYKMTCIDTDGMNYVMDNRARDLLAKFYNDFTGEALEGYTPANNDSASEESTTVEGKESKPYWAYKRIPLGQSDVASLTLTGCSDGELTAHILPMGEDGDYCGYVLEHGEGVPKGFEHFQTFSSWLHIYDDSRKTAGFHGPVEVLRNEFGAVVIRMLSEDAELEHLRF
jgi:hypothetical protein